MATFTATLELHGKTATGIEVPEEIVAGLGGGKKPAVRVTIRGYTYRTTVAVMGGRFLIPVSAEHREKAQIAAGDMLEVELALDTEPRELVVPADFLEALARHEKAKSFFEGLSYSNKRRFVLSIEEAKTAETRQRRIEKAVSTLALEIM
ncbi:YdeI/OmpD-associated family protein [Paenibacillus flagellatus]|uniref:DUF1905 domain-containing protein n=1 Tax=Paenibacillus flagellatus TaxID=2211139 RepID=A0A2V5KFP1_9BACL|nr:YdeI/OmpD-associated family protein [Paenibacillus flagellatus]PYI56973.1 hypothetical protein DLM86_00550 [Paenibacillus flagellatus]